MHEDDPAPAPHCRPRRSRDNVELLRELGATMTRAHYPLHPLALELADRYGILVWSEVPVYQMADSLFRNARRCAGRRSRCVRDMVNRDRSHPSVLVWSLGNENTSRPGSGFTRYIRSASAPGAPARPDRLVGLAFPGYPTVGKQQLYTELDALGVNDYFGWYAGPQNSIAERAGTRPLPGAAARATTAPGAVRDRVRSRGEPSRARIRERGRSPSSRTSSPTTWACSQRSPS